MNEHDTITPAEKLAQFRLCPKCNVDLVYYDGALGYESFVCPVCHLDINDWPKPEEPWDMAKVAKLLGIGLNPESGTPTSPASASQEEVRGVDTPETPSEYTGTIPAGTWATEDQAEWTERREAFSNEGEVEP